MSQLQARGLDTIRNAFPQVYTALLDIVKGINLLGTITGVGTLGPTPAPSNVGSLDVTASGGIFDVMITDPRLNRGECYFLEYGTDPSFQSAYVMSLGPVRNWRGYLGNITVYWRFYKQYLGSNVSPYYVFGGSNPTGVAGGGAAGPSLHPTQGSGSSLQPGFGYGRI